MKWLFFMVLLAPILLHGQNLVPNGGFEDNIDCPSNISQLELANPWKNPTGGTPDYFHLCSSHNSTGVPSNAFGNQLTYSGDAYSGVYTFLYSSPNLREYIQTELTDTLTKGIEYAIGFWASLCDDYNYSISKLGAYLSKDPVSRSDANVIQVVPQILNLPLSPLSDKENWVLIMDTFVSVTGGEKYITIGNFFEAIESDTLLLTPGAQSKLYAYYYIDDVFVMPLDSFVGITEKEISEFNLYPNPNDGNMYLEYTGLMGEAVFYMYDMVGRKVCSYQLIGESGKISISEQKLESGLYTYRILNENQVFRKGKVVINR